MSLEAVSWDPSRIGQSRESIESTLEVVCSDNRIATVVIVYPSREGDISTTVYASLDRSINRNRKNSRHLTRKPINPLETLQYSFDLSVTDAMSVNSRMCEVTIDTNKMVYRGEWSNDGMTHLTIGELDSGKPIESLEEIVNSATHVTIATSSDTVRFDSFPSHLSELVVHSDLKGNITFSVDSLKLDYGMLGVLVSKGLDMSKVKTLEFREKDYNTLSKALRREIRSGVGHLSHALSKVDTFIVESLTDFKVLSHYDFTQLNQIVVYSSYTIAGVATQLDLVNWDHEGITYTALDVIGKASASFVRIILRVKGVQVELEKYYTTMLNAVELDSTLQVSLVGMDSCNIEYVSIPHPKVESARCHIYLQNKNDTSLRKRRTDAELSSELASILGYDPLTEDAELSPELESILNSLTEDSVKDMTMES